ncbi:hypothetical protein TNCV_562091 [Trichonephila clavipes]|uniref:Uncharacterized protein n=1 Tax=Trichonephila clavipes TaxID=2585209 RepID=A0A8X6V517_TRICX|nr:hypothetical protein TNCV_562091 [Trichonephila clavipes]
MMHTFIQNGVVILSLCVPGNITEVLWTSKEKIKHNTSLGTSLLAEHFPAWCVFHARRQVQALPFDWEVNFDSQQHRAYLNCSTPNYFHCCQLWKPI